MKPSHKNHLTPEPNFFVPSSFMPNNMKRNQKRFETDPNSNSRVLKIDTITRNSIFLTRPLDMDDPEYPVIPSYESLGAKSAAYTKPRKSAKQFQKEYEDNGDYPPSFTSVADHSDQGSAYPQLQAQDTSKKLTAKKALLLLDQGVNMLGHRTLRRSNFSGIHPGQANYLNDDKNNQGAQPKKSLEKVYRRRSCTCSWCGGISCLEKATQNLPGLPLLPSSRQPIVTETSLMSINKTANKSLVGNRPENRSKFREKVVNKLFASSHSLLGQARNTVREVQTPSASPRHEKSTSKFGSMGGGTKFDSIPKMNNLEYKDQIGGEEAKNALNAKMVSRTNTSKFDTFERSASIDNHIKLIDISENPIAPVENSHRSALGQMNKTHDTSLRRIVYSGRIFTSPIKHIIPKLKTSHFQNTNADGETIIIHETLNTPGSKDIKTAKGKLRKITSPKVSDTSNITIKKVYGLPSPPRVGPASPKQGQNSPKGGQSSPKAGQSSPKTGGNVMDFYSSILGRSRSLPMNKLIEEIKPSKLSAEKVKPVEHSKGNGKAKGKKRKPELKKLKIKVRELSPGNSDFISGLISSPRSPNNLKTMTSSRSKKSGRSEWLVKTYKIAQKKD